MKADPLALSELGEMKNLASNLFNRMLRMIKTDPERILPVEIETVSFDFGSNGTQLLSAAKILFTLSKQYIALLFIIYNFFFLFFSFFLCFNFKILKFSLNNEK